MASASTSDMAATATSDRPPLTATQGGTTAASVSASAALATDGSLAASSPDVDKLVDPDPELSRASLSVFCANRNGDLPAVGRMGVTGGSPARFAIDALTASTSASMTSGVGTLSGSSSLNGLRMCGGSGDRRLVGAPSANESSSASDSFEEERDSARLPTRTGLWPPLPFAGFGLLLLLRALGGRRCGGPSIVAWFLTVSTRAAEAARVERADAAEASTVDTVRCEPPGEVRTLAAVLLLMASSIKESPLAAASASDSATVTTGMTFFLALSPLGGGAGVSPAPSAGPTGWGRGLVALALVKADGDPAARDFAAGALGTRVTVTDDVEPRDFPSLPVRTTFQAASKHRIVCMSTSSLEYDTSGLVLATRRTYASSFCRNVRATSTSDAVTSLSTHRTRMSKASDSRGPVLAPRLAVELRAGDLATQTEFVAPATAAAAPFATTAAAAAAAGAVPFAVLGRELPLLLEPRDRGRDRAARAALGQVQWAA
mmetsp:Transcript_14631/g.43309  ORF Transcript_14631/g.43309 Transcript_14631/m.43309 type:complete len:489 (+) Transcript_14631:1860-3326(+)